MARPLRFALVALCLGLGGCPAPRVPKGAALLYDVDFSAPEQTAMQAVKTVMPESEHAFPTKFPSRVFLGLPRVVAKLCGLREQPALLSASTGTQGYEGLEFLLDPRYGRYHVELDLCVERIDAGSFGPQVTQVAVFLDIAEAHAIGFVSGGDIVILDPSLPPEAPPTPIARFEPRKPLHLAFDADVEKQTWRIAVDGKTVYDGPLKATLPRAVRVLVRGNPSTAAAFDNLLIWGEHDLTPADEAAEPAAPPSPESPAK